MRSYKLTGNRTREGNDHIYSGTLLVIDGSERYSFTYNAKLPADLSRVEKREWEALDFFVIKRKDGQEIGEEKGKRAFMAFIEAHFFKNLNGLEQVNFPISHTMSLDDIGEGPSKEATFGDTILQFSRMAYDLEEPLNPLDL